MKPKLYPTEKVAEVARTLAEAPALPPKFIPHSETLAELSKHIKDLYFRKNYEPRQIAQMLKESGIKTTIKEVKNILQIGTQRSHKPREKTTT